LPVVLPLGLLGSWIAVPLLVGLTATRVAIAVTAQLTSARWGVASDCEISAASRTTWLDVGFALSVGAVVDALWKHELAPGAALCIVATISFAISPPGGGALRAFSAALLAVGCIWRWQELGER